MSFKNTRHARKGLIPAHCEIPGCTFTAFVTKHRIKPGRKGGKYVPGNVIGLCPNCHSLAELGLFSQYELFRIVHNRLQQESGSKEMSKRCNKCGEDKLHEEFGKNIKASDGLRPECNDVGGES